MKMTNNEKTRVTIPALPGHYIVPEITTCWSPAGNKAYFGGDTMLAPEVRTIAQAGRVDAAILPRNGLNVDRIGGCPGEC